MMNALVQTHVMLMRRIDAEVRAVLYNTYRGRIKFGPFDAIGFGDKATADSFMADYNELTKLYIAKYADKLKALEHKDQN